MYVIIGKDRKRNLERKVIGDGVCLNVIQTDKFKTNYLSFNFVIPLEKERASLNALIPQVLIRGTEKHRDIASIKNCLDDLYAASVEGRVYRRGECQVCGMTASWLADRYAIDGTDVTNGTLDMLEELVFHPYTEDGAFKRKYVETEKSNLIDEIRGIINNKNSYAIRRAQEEMCRGEAFGICEYGDEKSVLEIDEKNLFAAYSELLKRARIEIFYVGSGDMDKLSERVKKMFENQKRECADLPATEVIKTVGEVKEITEECSAVQGKLSLGFRTGCVLGEKDYDAFPVFVEMFGNSPVSKLFMNVREKLSLCYYCRAIPEGIKGVMVVASGIEVSNREKAQNEILAQLDNVRNGVMTEEEVTLAKKSLKNAYSELTDSPSALEGWYLTRILAGVDDTPERVCERFMSVTSADIAEAARKVKLDTVYFLKGTLKDGGEREDE